MLADMGIAVSLMPPVKDLSFLENENAWLYRAMAEYSVSFVMEADGAYGISCFEAQPENGGSAGTPDSGGNGTGTPGSGNAGDSGSGENTGVSDSGGSGNTQGSDSGSSLKEQDFSDGGTKELADTLIGTIKDVEITGEYKE